MESFDDVDISNQKKTQIKKYIIEALDELTNSKILQTQFKIVKTNGSVIQVNKLNKNFKN